MAVGQGRTTPSKRGMRRAHDFLTTQSVSTEPTSGARHLRHHITADGFYRGKQVIKTKVAKKAERRKAENNDE